MCQRILKSILFCSICGIALLAQAQESITPASDSRKNIDRLVENQQFHIHANQKPGLLIPLYIYPTDIHKNESFNQVMNLKRKYSEIPFWVILNPASGPGTEVNANYTKAVDRLIGSGCQVLGYVPTGYAKKEFSKVQADIKAWREFYPRVQGIFFDEMVYDDQAASVSHQKRLNETAHRLGFWPTVGNPGAATPESYFAEKAADVIVVHEADSWPTKTYLHGDYFGGYSDYPTFTRAVLVHSQSNCDPGLLKMSTQYAKWIYVTDDTFKAGDPTHPNPWDQLSSHLETMCETIRK